MDDLAARIGSFELYFESTLLVALLTVVWVIFSRFAEEFYFWLSLRTRQIELTLQPKDNIPDNITSLNLLFIRYGNDKYLSTIASERDRHHGRLRNNVIRIADKPPANGGPILLKLKVHKRLGSQFKFFIDVKGDPAAAYSYLKSHETLEVDKPQLRPRLRSDDTDRHRIFFLLKRLDVVETVEGFRNNFIYPI